MKSRCSKPPVTTDSGRPAAGSGIVLWRVPGPCHRGAGNVRPLWQGESRPMIRSGGIPEPPGSST